MQKPAFKVSHATVLSRTGARQQLRMKAPLAVLHILKRK
jgi:hypothetical protein